MTPFEKFQERLYYAHLTAVMGFFLSVALAGVILLILFLCGVSL
jgi:hypothetical protein